MQMPGRDVKPDIKYNSKLLAKLINYVMQEGKKSTAERSVYAAFDKVDERSDAPALEVFNAAVTNCSPRLEVRTRRVGGANYQVPYEVPQERQISLALRWIVRAARERSGNTMGGVSPRRSWMRHARKGRPITNASMFTVWQKRTAPSRTIAGSFPQLEISLRSCRGVFL
jgi:small subunit ribosomal protein S7